MKVKKLIIHHSLTKDGQVVDWNAIRRYHIEVNGWDDIGYHYGVERAGAGYILQVGRAENVNGAHAKGMNDQSLGICVVGNYDLGPVPEEAMVILVDLCAKLCRKYGLKAEDIETHNKYATYKTCPGKAFPMAKLKELIRVNVC